MKSSKIAGIINKINGLRTISVLPERHGHFTKIASSYAREALLRHLVVPERHLTLMERKEFGDGEKRKR